MPVELTNLNWNVHNHRLAMHLKWLAETVDFNPAGIRSVQRNTGNDRSDAAPAIARNQHRTIAGAALRLVWSVVFGLAGILCWLTPDVIVDAAGRCRAQLISY